MAHPGAGWLALAVVSSSIAVPPPALANPLGTPAARRVLVQRALISQEAAERVFDQLQLTLSQRQECMTIVRKDYLANRQLRDKAQDAWHALMVLLRSPAASLNEVLGRQREVGRLQEILAEKRLVTWFAVRKLLTSVQLARLSSLSLDPAGIGESNGEQGDGNARNDAKH